MSRRGPSTGAKKKGDATGRKPIASPRLTNGRGPLGPGRGRWIQAICAHLGWPTRPSRAGFGSEMPDAIAGLAMRSTCQSRSSILAPRPRNCTTRRESITLAPPRHHADHAGERPARDPDVLADGVGGLGHDRKSRAEHLVDLLEVAPEGLLVDDFEHLDQRVGLERLQAVERVAEQEEISREQGDDGPDRPAHRRALLLGDQRQIEREAAS